jgi:methyltransferase (TIGR00027 family)
MVGKSDDTPSGVGETAIGAAMMRARESLRVDPLFDDPFAAAFVDAAPPVFEEGPTAEDSPELAALEAAFEDAVSVRTRFYDEFVLAAAQSGLHQLVLLGAGLDSRAFRLTLPSDLRLFELDTPEVLAFKERVLSDVGATPRCDRMIVASDLREDWMSALREAGFRTHERTGWVIEGVIPYLPDGDAERLLVSVSELSTPGARLALDQPTIPDDSLLARARELQAMDEITSMWKGGMREDTNTATWLREHRWSADAFDSASLASMYGRTISAVANGGFIRATRLERRRDNRHA